MNTTLAAEARVAGTGLTRPDVGPVVGVRTTQIYCRPVCRPGRAPTRENCVPFPGGSAAREAGYRPCKQCRPDDLDPPARARAAGYGLTILYGVGPSPVGFLLVAGTGRGICALYMLESADDPTGLERLRRDFPGAWIHEDPDAAGLLDGVVGWVTGEAPGDLPLDLYGTPFQLRVWDALVRIPRGTTTTYGGLAVSIGLPPGAARAVGTACGSNKVTLLVPCHRVVRSGGGLGGYYWGLDRKRAILDLERSPVALAPG